MAIKRHSYVYCDSLAGLLLAVKHWPAERLNFIARGEEISMGKGERRHPVLYPTTPSPSLHTPPQFPSPSTPLWPAVEYMHRGCLLARLELLRGWVRSRWLNRVFDEMGTNSENDRSFARNYRPACKIILARSRSSGRLVAVLFGRPCRSPGKHHAI